MHFLNTIVGLPNKFVHIVGYNKRYIGAAINGDLKQRKAHLLSKTQHCKEIKCSWIQTPNSSVKRTKLRGTKTKFKYNSKVKVKKLKIKKK